MEKAETKVNLPITPMNTSTWGMDGVQGKEHTNIAYLNNTLFNLIQRVNELESRGD